MKKWVARPDNAKIPKEWRMYFEDSQIDRVVLYQYASDDRWLLTVYSLGIENQELKSKDVEEAKKEALQIVDGIVTEMYNSIKDVSK